MVLRGNMSLFILVGIVSAALIMMVIDANKLKAKGKRIRSQESDFPIDTKKLADVTKRMEILHQEQEIARVTNRFSSAPSASKVNIRLNRNF
ncbi:MAG: hypothetical protein WD512_02705 [Candidatus Paceibacterota bacterium]